MPVQQLDRATRRGKGARQGNPEAKKAMDKEWSRLREMDVWDESNVREWADVAAEAIKENEKCTLAGYSPSVEKRTANWQTTTRFESLRVVWCSKAIM